MVTMGGGPSESEALVCRTRRAGFGTPGEGEGSDTLGGPTLLGWPRLLDAGEKSSFPKPCDQQNLSFKAEKDFFEAIFSLQLIQIVIS